MKDILDGSKQLLSESIELIGNSVDDIVIVGGWGPYLRHTKEHPGTKDVDILFPENYSREVIEKIIDRFLDNGFFISAKHDFQLCRAYKIGKHTYIYNVDLLHPTKGKINKVDFVEIMDLDVTDRGIRVKPIISINIQYGDVIQSEKLFQNTNLYGKKVNVLDGAGIVISKLNSCHNKKRPRDIFDIYLSLLEKNTLQKINYLISINPLLRENVEKYVDKLNTKWEIYEQHLLEFNVEDPGAKGVLLMGH